MLSFSKLKEKLLSKWEKFSDTYPLTAHKIKENIPNTAVSLCAFGLIIGAVAIPFSTASAAGLAVGAAFLVFMDLEEIGATHEAEKIYKKSVKRAKDSATSFTLDFAQSVVDKCGTISDLTEREKIIIKGISEAFAEAKAKLPKEVNTTPVLRTAPVATAAAPKTV